MTNGNDILEFEEQHFEELSHDFVEHIISKDKYIGDKWYAFVENRYSEHGAGYEDEAYDRWRDSQLEEGNK